MMARRQFLLPARMGLVLAALGLLASAVSYFLLPLLVTPCIFGCAQPRHNLTAWALSLRILSLLPSSPITSACLLALCYLPLLAAVMVVGCLLGFLVWPQRAFVTWSHRVWLTGSITLAFLLLVVLVVSLFGPASGFFGLPLGYALLWVGNHVVFNSTSSR